jgi:mono/diheme cytochrome c family protein
VLLAGVLAVSCSSATAAQPGEDPDEPARGLLVRYASTRAGGPVSTRIASGLSAEWGLGSPDARIPIDALTARWTGLLLVQEPGRYQFFATSSGPLALWLGDRRVLEGSGDSVRGKPVELGAGFTPIRLEFRHAGGPARVAVDWSGPSFRRERVPPRLLFRERAAGSPVDPFERGRMLADQLGCANCHPLLDLPPHPQLGPNLADAGTSIAPGWLDAWLTEPARVRPQTRMPAFGSGLGPQDVADLTAFLKSAAGRPSRPSDELKMALNLAAPSNGRLLFRSLGCLSCHARDATEPATSTARGPDLKDLAAKRTAPWVATYLARPRPGAPSLHRADLRITPDEAAALAAYLTSGAAQPKPEAQPTGGDPARGRQLAARHRCAACHEIPGLGPPRPDLPLKSGSRPDAGCLSAAAAGPAVPRFALSDSDRDALRALIAGLPANPAPTSPDARASDIFRRRNCFGCHIREGEPAPALSARIARLVGDDPALAGLKGTLTPPSLSAVGDKLRPEFLNEAVRGKAPPARPWLSVRMPTFAFEPGEAEAIVAYFQRHDGDRSERGGDEQPASRAISPPAHSSRLIGQKGFGCLSCHVIDGRIPPGGEAETLGPDLALSHRRMTERYFYRWLDNPQRIIAGTAMPQFIKPVPTVGGTLDEQLHAVWQLLGDRQALDASSETREFLKRDGERPLVVFDMVLVPGAPTTPYTPRAIAVGLKNEHTLLFDADRLTWLAWWRAGFVYRTKTGRLWEWHPEGDRLWTAPARLAPIVFLDDGGTVRPPIETRERFGRFLAVEVDGASAIVSYTLHAPGGAEVRVHERIAPRGDGWERAIEVSEVPPTLWPALEEFPPRSSVSTNGGKTLEWKSPSNRLHLEIDGAPIAAPPELAQVAHLFKMGRRAPGVYDARVRFVREVAP